MSEKFEFTLLPIAGLYRVTRKPISDERGSFSRFFCAKEFREVGFTKPIAQINHSFTRQKGSIRGMHFQLPPHAEAKIVTCLKGAVFDVVVDIRKNSPTFLRWHAETLCPEDESILYIPEGLAHGFQTLADDCELLYLHSSYYQPTSEAGLNPADPTLAIDWPLKTTEISARDQNHPLIDDSFTGT